MASASLTGSSKRAKAPGNAVQVANCSVDGCDADLSQCREYHRRHKVCEAHSKTAKVTVGGRELRFCQQCSRFHLLTEFDEGKRSCRKRLDGHNKRRRKPQPESLNRSSPMQLYSSSPQGAKLLQFGSSELFPSTAVSSAWSSVIKAEDEMVLYSNQPHFSYIDRPKTLQQSNQFQFLQGPEASSISQPNDNRGQRGVLFPDGFDHIVDDSDRALSLLSPVQAVTREIGFSNSVQFDEGLSNHYTFSQETETKPIVSDFQELLQNTPYGSSSSSKTLTFRWE